MKRTILIGIMALILLSGCSNQPNYTESIEVLEEENLALKSDLAYWKNELLTLESEINEEMENYNALNGEIEEKLADQIQSNFELRMEFQAYLRTAKAADEFIKAYCTNDVAVMEDYLNFNVSIMEDQIIVDYTDVYKEDKLVNLINKFPILSNDAVLEYEFWGIDYIIDESANHASMIHSYRIYKEIGINQYIYELSIGINEAGKIWYILVQG